MLFLGEIRGNINAIKYKKTFPLFLNNQVWLGASIHSRDQEFKVPDDYPLKATNTRFDETGNKYIRVRGCVGSPILSINKDMRTYLYINKHQCLRP